MTPIAAMALFGGACFANRKMAYLLPLAAMLLSDLVLGCTRYGLWSLARAFSRSSMPASWPPRRSASSSRIGVRVWQVGAAALAGSLLFFVVTNFAAWAGGQLYPLTASGLAACYVAAIPFFRNSLAGDARLHRDPCSAGWRCWRIGWRGCARAPRRCRRSSRRSHARRFSAGQRHGDRLRPGRGRVARRPVARMRQPAVGDGAAGVHAAGV